MEDRSKGRSTTSLVLDAGVFFKDNEIEETEETHIIPRKSLTVKQHLGLFSPDVETVDLVKRQLVTNPTTGEITVAASTDTQIVWKGDTNLLKSNPFKGQDGRVGEFKRLTARSKRIKYENEDVDPTDYLIRLLRLTFKGRDFRIVTL